MTHKKLLLFLCLLLCGAASAQSDTITRLQEVIISDTQLRDFSKSQSVLLLNDSVIVKNQPSLTSLLNYNTVIYFKENGLGMVSSPSFRGTTAQQTVVLWNGININSQLNGQTDFNTINTYDFTSMSVRAGGGSVIYGSSAIGGSIHLNNGLTFTNRFTNEARISYGSFTNKSLNYRVGAGNDKFSTSVSFTHNDSDNDYDYVATDGKNLNGQFYNNSINAVAGYRFNDNNDIRLYSYIFDGERHFSLIFPSENKTKYQDTNSRNMLEWDSRFGKFISKVKAAFLQEQYKYFQNTDSDSYTYGKVETLIGRYDLTYNPLQNIKLNTIIDFTQNKGYGSDIAFETRHVASAALLLSHSVTNRFAYEAGIRKEVTSNYNSPLLYSAGITITPAQFYTLKLNSSKNFRVPTFNDLYWQDGGNPDLNPETSWQAEIGNEFTVNNVSLTVTGYYIKIKDMLRWLPTAGVWRPQNTSRVQTCGGEGILSFKKTFGIHNLSLNGTYAYTISEDEETGNQLIYVPYHKVTAGVSYGYKKLTAFYQYLYNGEVFTRSDNNSLYNVAAYNVSNIGADYNFGKNNTYRIGVQAANVLNKAYVSVDSRPLPGRNYNVYLNLNF